MYFLHEAIRFSAKPVASILDAGQSIYRHEANPWRNSLLHKSAAASCDLMHRILKEYPKPEYNVRNGEQDDILVEEIVKELPFGNLLHFPVSGASEKPKVMIASALSGHHSTLLRDTARGFARDFDPYMTDWKDAKGIPVSEGSFDLDGYTAHLIEFIETLGPGVNLVATCQSAPAAMVACAYLAKHNPELVPPTLTLMAGPIDTRINKNMINKLTDVLPLWLFKVSNIKTVPFGKGKGRTVYPGFYQLSGFVLMNFGLHFGKHKDYFLDTIKGKDTSGFTSFYDEYNSVLDVTEEFYMDTLKRVFFEHHIPTGQMTYRGEPVDFTLLTEMALLTVEGSKDDLCPVGQTEAAHGVMSGLSDENRGHYIQEGVGHLGVFSGSKFQSGIYPVIRDFIQANLR